MSKPSWPAVQENIIDNEKTILYNVSPLSSDTSFGTAMMLG